jgi:enamine deaminase RidA (YjgF/YER057c/UK114 family)
MSKIHRIDPGPRLSEALVCGDRLYTSGLVADDGVGPSVYLQTKDILRQVDALLQQNGTDKTRILKANIWLADIGSFDEMNRAWDEWVIPGQTPVRATVEAKLADPIYKVEIMFEALIGD